MKDNQRKRGEQIELFLLVVVLAVFAAVISVVTSGGKKQAMEQMRILSSGWYYMENGEKTEITLPTVIKAENGEPLTLYNDGITGEDAGKTISTRGAQYDLMISLNGKILYEYQESSFKRNTQMKSKLDCDGEFPVDLQDGTLILTYSQPQHGKYEILPVYIGSGRDVAICHFLDSMGTMGSAFCFIILSVIALAAALYLRYRQIPAGRFRDVALFLMICGIWLITDSSLVQSYSSHPDIICIVSFYMFMMLAVPILHFVQKIGDMKKYGILNLGIFLFYINALLQGLLNYLGIFRFTQMLFVTHILLWAWVLISVTLLWKEYRKEPKREILTVMIAYTILGVSGIVALILYWLLNISYYGTIYGIGILIFLILIIQDTIVNMAKNIRYRTEMQAYERLMQEDRMTGLPNREPFENCLTGIRQNAEKYKDILLVFLDINHLRTINGEFGRAAGDEVVLATVRCMKNAFGKNATCYRTGGDEFAALIYDPEMNQEMLEKRLEEEIRNYNRNSRYRLSVACGFSSVRDRDGKIKALSEWKYEADTDMYQNKTKEGKAHGL